jgi:hypothetical protein
MTRKSSVPLRAVIVRITIVSFSVAALMGVVALLGGGDFGETEGKVLLTTLLVGVASVAVLCCLATAGGSYRAVGAVGAAVVLVPLGTGLAMIWGSGDEDVPLWLARTFGVGSIAAATLAQASLLLAIARRARPWVRRLLGATLLLGVVLFVLASALVLGAEPGGVQLRVLGVVAILDVLGTVVVAALSRFGTETTSEPASALMSISPALLAEIDAFATRTGRSREQTVSAALREYLAEQRVGGRKHHTG